MLYLFWLLRETNSGIVLFYPLSEAIPYLVQVINDPEARNSENINATENAISAVTKICKYNHGNIAVDDLIPTWLTWLPITEDKEEAPHVYGYLCDLIQGCVLSESIKPRISVWF